MKDRVASYAAAMVEIATAEGDLDRVETELRAIGQAVDQDSELRRTLTDPRLPAERKRTLLEQILSGRASPTTVDLVGLVIDRGRGGDLPEIAAAMSESIAVGQGKKLAEIRTAVPLNESQVERLSASLTKLVGSQVEIQVTVDPTLLGGMITRVGDMVIDGTLRRQLNDLRQALS